MIGKGIVLSVIIGSALILHNAEKRDQLEFQSVVAISESLIKGGSISPEDYKKLAWSIQNRSAQLSKNLRQKGMTEDQINRVLWIEIKLK